MIKVIIAALVAATFVIGLMPAHATTQDSARYAEFKANCGNAAGNPDAMSQAQFDMVVARCRLRAGLLNRQRLAGNDVVVRPKVVVNEPRDEDDVNVDDDYGRRPSRGIAHCPPGFHFSKVEGACVNKVVVSGGHPKYDVPREQAHCRIGSVRSFWTKSPEGYRRKVDQVCR